MKAKRYGNYLRIDDQMTWPLPNPELGWTLRYGTPIGSDLLAAASIVSAYQSLISTTEKSRRAIVRELKKAFNEKMDEQQEGQKGR